MSEPVNTTANNPVLNQNISVSDSGQITFGGVKVGLQEAMAMLFMQRAETMSQLATDRAGTAQNNLHEIQTARTMLSKMRALKQQAADNKDHHHKTEMPPDMVKFCDDNHIECQSNDKESNYWHSKEQWDVSIQSMQNHIDKLSSDNDLFMIKLKGVINKAQEATQAADAFVTKNKEVMSSIISNLSR